MSSQTRNINQKQRKIAQATRSDTRELMRKSRQQRKRDPRMLRASRELGLIEELFEHCNNFFNVYITNEIPPLSGSNGYAYLPELTDLPKLDPLTERLIQPQILHKQMPPLRYKGTNGIVEKIINISIDIKRMTKWFSIIFRQFKKNFNTQVFISQRIP